MRLAVFSDAHRNITKMEDILKDLSDIDYLIYAGDGLEKVIESEVVQEFNLLAIQGNCDHVPSYPREKVIDLAQLRILLVHGKRYRIKWGLDNLYYKAKEVGADIVIFGHTHARYAGQEDDILFFNPGSISEPRDNKSPSYGILNLAEREIDYNHFSYSNNDNGSK